VWLAELAIPPRYSAYALGIQCGALWFPSQLYAPFSMFFNNMNTSTPNFIFPPCGWGVNISRIWNTALLTGL
jgi:hypothetical protein